MVSSRTLWRRMEEWGYSSSYNVGYRFRSASFLGHFTLQRKRARYPLNERLGGTYSQSIHWTKQKSFAPAGSRNPITSKWCTYITYTHSHFVLVSTWCDNKVRELIAVKVLRTSLLNTTVVAFKVLPLESYAPMPAPSPPFETILELVLWNGLQSCRCITPDVSNVIKMPSF